MSVPQDPAAWDAPKLGFRDISAHPTFWLDHAGTVVNGDCYWPTADRPDDEGLLWLAAAVANSTFIEGFYDHRFNNKLTQYVELFRLPDPTTELAQAIVAAARASYAHADPRATAAIEARLNPMVWQAFGLRGEEVAR